jgi:hypothetical protein
MLNYFMVQRHGSRQIMHYTDWIDFMPFVLTI